MGDSPQAPDPARRRLVRRRRRLARRRGQQRLAGGIAALLAACAAAVALALSGGGNDEAARPAELVSGAAPTALELSREQAEQHAEAVDEVLAYTPYLRAGTESAPEVAITFDDGPSIYTDDILRVLRRFDAPATFFVLGEMVEARPQLVRRALAQGHAIGSHSLDHPQFGQLAPEAQEAELESVDSIMRAQGLAAPRLFRPPYGSFDLETLSLLDQRAELMVLWSVDTGDYENPGWQVIADRALAEARPGSVILLHDGGGDRAQTLVALPLILKGLERAGLRPVTVPQLLADNPPPRDQSLEQAAGIPQPGENLPDGPETPPSG